MNTYKRFALISLSPAALSTKMGKHEDFIYISRSSPAHHEQAPHPLG
jgi:hypothetical protein